MAITKPDEYGLQVRVSRNGKAYSRYFGFREHGGERAATAAARIYQAKLLQIPVLPSSEPSKRNRTTGLRGIALVRYKDRKRGLTMHEYKVSYRDPKNGKRKVRTFYIGTDRTYDKKRAAATLKRAVRFRAQREKEWRRAVGAS